jgi:OOP family OmpA-OmpF porin
VLALWTIAVAAAQSEAATPRPAVESARLLTVEDARAHTGWGLSARAYGLGDPLTPALTGAHLSLAGGFGPARLGLDAPIGAAGLGAARLSGRLIAPWGVAERPGLGLWGAVVLQDAPVGELGLLADAQLGLVTGALTLGARGGDGLAAGFGRAGASVAVFDALNVSAEVHLDAPGLNTLSWSAVGAARAQLGPWVGLGLGVDWRPEDDRLSAMLGLSFSAQSAADGDRDGVKDERDACPRRAEDEDGFEDEDGCPDPDNDQDGLDDAQDACPDQPAPDRADGCPVGLGLVRVRLVWTGAAPDALAELRLSSADPEAPSQLIRGLGADIELSAGTWTLDVTAPGMLPAQRALTVPGGGTLDVELILSPDPSWSTQRLQVVNHQGQPVEAIIRVDGARRPAPGGALDLRLPPSPVTVSVEAIGYRGEVLRLSPTAGVDRVQQVILTPLSRANLTDGQLILREPLRFAPGTATLTPASQAMLDEVGSILRAQPELGLVRVEGFCELYGDEDQDVALSQAQADAVVAALIARGLSPDRLLAIGFGPPETPQEGIRQSARFFIERPEDELVEPPPTP